MTCLAVCAAMHPDPEVALLLDLELDVQLGSRSASWLREADLVSGSVTLIDDRLAQVGRNSPVFRSISMRNVVDAGV